MRRLAPQTLALATLALTIAAGVACSGPSSDMTSPTPVGSSGTLAGTVVTGTATSGPSQADRIATLKQTPAGLTITVVGTGLSAHTDANGAFVIEGIPAGASITLHFSGSGVNATLTLDGVDVGEVRHITIRVEGSDAEIEDDDRDEHQAGVQEVEGLISALNPGGRSIMVNGLVIAVPTGTPIVHGSRAYDFADLRVGDRVHVKAVRASGVLTAQEVKLQNGAATPGNGNK